jgi:hypothetical protein
MKEVFAILISRKEGKSQSGARGTVNGAARVKVLHTSPWGVFVRILNSGGPAAYPEGAEVSVPFGDVYASKEELKYFAELVDFFWGTGLPVGPRPPCSLAHDPGEAGDSTKEDSCRISRST